MPNQNHSDSPATDSKGQPLPQVPVTPAAPQENEIRKGSESSPDEENDKTVQLEKDIRSGERWLIGISAAGVVLNVIIALIYYGQLGEMRKATIASTKAADAATSAADTANKTLNEIRAGSTDTHQLAVGAGKQADAAQSANRTNEEALTSVQRAFIIVNSQPTMLPPERNQIGAISEYRFQMIMENAGNTPTKSLQYHTNLVEWGNAPLPDDYTFPDLDADGQVCRKKNPKPGAVVQAVAGPKSILWSHILKLSPAQADILQSRGHIYFYGWAEYRDIFDKTPWHRTEYCTELMSVSANGEMLFGGCPTHNCTDKDCKDYKP